MFAVRFFSFYNLLYLNKFSKICPVNNFAFGLIGLSKS